jgi:hypothetical protein
MGTQWWDTNGMPTPAEWQALAAFAGVAVGIIAAVFALLQLRAFFAAQWQQNRPYIILDAAIREGFVVVEIINISSSAAVDVAVRPSRPFESTMPRLAESITERLGGGFKFSQISPHRRFRYPLDGMAVFQSELPRKYEGTVTYRDAVDRRRGIWWTLWVKKKEVQYTEPFIVDLDQLTVVMLEQETFESMASSLHAIERYLAKPHKSATLSNIHNRFLGHTDGDN